MPPYLTGEPPLFAFLVHPRDNYDLHLVPGASVIAAHSSSESEFVDKILSLPPMVAGEFTFGIGRGRGEMIGVVCMPERIMHLHGRRQIADAVRLAGVRGAPVLGLGALTAPATRSGVALLDILPRGLTLTTGNAYTAAVVRCNAAEASDFLGLGTRATVAMVGCTGSVGVAASRLLAADGYELLLIGRRPDRVERELPDLARQHRVSGDPADVGQADVVLLLTGDPTARLTPGMARPGSIVIDFAQPVNVDPSRYGEFLRDGVRVVEGGLVMIPNYRCTVDIRISDGRAALACLAETYLLAREGIREHSVGQPSVELALELERVAARHGVGPRPLDLERSLAAAALRVTG